MNRRPRPRARPAPGPGYDGGTPPRLVEVPPTGRDMAMFITPENTYLRCYRLGGCTVLVTRELGAWHLSIAHPERYPTWDEVAAARYAAIPDGATMAMLLPSRAHYVNLHRFCFQVVEVPPGGPARDPDPTRSTTP